MMHIAIKRIEAKKRKFVAVVTKPVLSTAEKIRLRKSF